MLEKLFHASILDWNSVASQSLRNHSSVIPILTRPIVLSEQCLVIFGTSSCYTAPPLLLSSTTAFTETPDIRHELFAVSFSSDHSLLSRDTFTLEWNGYVTRAGIDDISSISRDKIVAAMEDSSLRFFQIRNNQLVGIDHISWPFHATSSLEEKTCIREMAYSKDGRLWCARNDGSLGVYHPDSGKWMMIKWSLIRDSFSSIQVVEDTNPCWITTTSDHGIFYGWDSRQATEAFHWNSHRQEMFAHRVSRNEVAIGFGDGKLSILDLRKLDDDALWHSNKECGVTWIDTQMQAIGNICAMDSSLWCCFGSSSEIWTTLQSSVAKRRWKVTLQETGDFFYAMNGNISDDGQYLALTDNRGNLLLLLTPTTSSSFS